jgi:hypothetical protein
MRRHDENRFEYSPIGADHPFRAGQPAMDSMAFHQFWEWNTGFPDHDESRCLKNRGRKEMSVL